MTPDLDAVVALVEQVARDALVAVEDVREKSAGEVVTAADLAAEALLTAGLHDLTPGVPVLGEEAASVDPSLLGLLVRPGPVWVVDPLDGTAAYVAGSPDHAVLVALVEDGATTAAVVHQPAHRRTWTAVRGGGAWRDGRRLRVRPAADPPRAAVLRRFLPPDVRARVDGALGEEPPPSTCAGVLYPQLAEGELDLLLFWRTLPWDHAAGVLLATEAGAAARRPGGHDYRPGAPGEGLLVTAPGVRFAL